MTAPAAARGVLLDFGSVVVVSPFEMFDALERRLGLAPGTIRRRRPFDPSNDLLWQAIVDGEVTEREYWADLAAEVGRLAGEEWGVKEFTGAVYSGPEDQFIRPQATALVEDARRQGIASGILSNELELFHGREWMTGVSILSAVDVLVDASITEVLKPDPASYRLAVDRLGLQPSEVVFVDDQHHNVAGARKAGLIAVPLDITDPASAFGEARRRLGLPEEPGGSS